jgi:hypothetical protein
MNPVIVRARLNTSAIPGSHRTHLNLKSPSNSQRLNRITPSSLREDSKLKNAPDWIRTSTAFRPLAPQASASTYSTTGAEECEATNPVACFCYPPTKGGTDLTDSRRPGQANKDRMGFLSHSPQWSNRESNPDLPGASRSCNPLSLLPQAPERCTCDEQLLMLRC